MQFQRSSGVLLHISSVPSYGGIGDLGPAAHEFVAFLAKAKQHVWQVLPLSPTGYGNSPYAASSAFAGNPALISLELLADWGWIERDRIPALAGDRSGPVDFQRVEGRKFPLLYEAAGNFLDRGPTDAKLAAQWQRFQGFCRAQADWLTDYALYAVLRRQFNTGAWITWPEPLRRRDPQALAEISARSARALAQEQALQFAFSVQWKRLREAAMRNAIRILGDVAIFVNMDSADVWSHPELFELDEELNPIRIAGVPPDYFSPTGQRWGNPLYRWAQPPGPEPADPDSVEVRYAVPAETAVASPALLKTIFAWWTDRIRRACQLYDIVRLDHFRGFEAYWSIPAEEETAVNGEWIKAPGMALFHALEAALGPLPLVAEDLGVITPEVDAMRHAFSFPGMKVLQFGFDNRGAHSHLPHRLTPNTVIYTGTHDNDTTQGWWNAATKTERHAVEALVGPVSDHPVWPLIRAAHGSVAQMAIVPAQDLLELGSEARMNTPAVAVGNWTWRAPKGCWSEKLSDCLAALAEVTDRDNDPLAKPEEGHPA